MHVHNNQFDPNLQLGAFYSAARAEAKKEAERVRTKLTHAASHLLGDYEEDCVVSLSGDQDSRQHPSQQSPEDESQSNVQPNAPAQNPPSATPTIFSDWA
jgi:hypothetical protein